MPQRGKLLVISFFLVGFILAAGAIWYHYAKTRWSMAFWGQENARLIVRAPEVELYRLTPAGTASTFSKPEFTVTLLNAPPSWELDGQTLEVVEQRVITETPGLIHMRMALVEDANFDITTQPPASRTWDYAFRFIGPEKSVIVAVDSHQGLVRVFDPASDRPTPIANIRPIAPGMRKFLNVQFSSDLTDQTNTPAETKQPAETTSN